MATGKKSQKQQTTVPLIPLKFQHLAAVLAILLSIVVFFNEIVFEGKVFVAADNIASKSFQTFVSDAEREGIFPLWNPYIFCGMPGYASLTIHGERYFDISALVINRASKLFAALLNNQDVGWVLLYYIILGVGIYFFIYDKLKNKVAALIGGLAVVHSTYIIILVMVGHMTKVPVIAFFPWIFLVVERLREKFSLWLSLVLVLLVHCMLLPGHIQMIFYCYFALGIYYLFFGIRTIIKKEKWTGYLRSGIVLAAATGIAFLMTGDQYLSTLEYSKYSMRGAGPIIPSAEAQKKGTANNTGSLDYDYATNWSFSPGEVFTFFIPSAYGFGEHKYRGPLTNNQEFKINTYFGPQPQPVDAPQYMGVVIIVLAAVGFWKNRKDPFVQYATVVISIALIISFGKEMPLLYDVMFNYFPLFNKFRIPNMILVLVQMLVPVLAAYGIVSLINGVDEKEKKNWMYGIAGLGLLSILALVAKNIFMTIYSSFYSEQEFVTALSRYYNPNVLTELYKIVTALVATDFLAAFVLLTIIFGAFYLYWKKSMKVGTLTVILVAAVLFDLWRVNYKPMDAKPHRDVEGAFATPNFVKFLQQDTTLFRTLQFENGQPPYDNTLAYWRIQSAYGYQGAKMRQIQDVFDVVGLGNPLLWGLMNVRYIISDRPDSSEIFLPAFQGEKYVLYNRAELPRAFFVNRYQVSKGLDILNNIKAMNFNPFDVAYGMEEITASVEPPKEDATVRYSNYGIQDLELKVHATGNNLIFLSESWYPEGWKAFIDGTETPIYRLNYMFRGIVVPKGEHSVTMKFEPTGFYLGKNLSLWLNILVLGGLGYYAVLFIVQKKRAASV
ncbi:MAG: YfhO family protein [Ignavibacteriales bacterium]|nr:YfhO family protein [Ignavibacteriales bacterium]